MLGVFERRRSREEFIRTYRFPPALRAKVRAEHPDLTDDDIALVFDALRDWFQACLRARRTIGMPSRVVDTAWHEFILMTRSYHVFCERAFGRYLHHEPSAVMAEAMGKTLIRTAAVLQKTPTLELGPGLPLLFGIDAALAIENGYEYTAADVKMLLEARRGYADGGCGGDGGGCGGDGGGCGGGCGGG